MTHFIAINDEHHCGRCVELPAGARYTRYCTNAPPGKVRVILMVDELPGRPVEDQILTYDEAMMFAPEFFGSTTVLPWERNAKGEARRFSVFYQKLKVDPHPVALAHALSDGQFTGFLSRPLMLRRPGLADYVRTGVHPTLGEATRALDMLLTAFWAR